MNDRCPRAVSVYGRVAAITFSAFICTALIAALPVVADAAPAARPDRIRIVYEPPGNPAHRRIYEAMREREVLERFQKFFSMLRLPRVLLIKFAGCDGSVNAAYDPESASITFCYENLDYIERSSSEIAARRGIKPDDVFRSTVIAIFLHETAHALFDLLKLPVLGREEDAADQVATYALLNLDKNDAKKIILDVLSGMERTAELETPTRDYYADVHSLTAQRLFNVMCLAYGSDEELFAGLADKDRLPKERAEGCWAEYEQVAHAVSTLDSTSHRPGTPQARPGAEMACITIRARAGNPWIRKPAGTSQVARPSDDATRSAGTESIDRHGRPQVPGIQVSFATRKTWMRAASAHDGGAATWNPISSSTARTAVSSSASSFSWSCSKRRPSRLPDTGQIGRA